VLWFVIYVCTYIPGDCLDKIRVI